MSNASPPPVIRAPQPDPEPPERISGPCINGRRIGPVVVLLGDGAGLCYRCARQRRLA